MRSVKTCVVCNAEFIPHRPCCVTCSRNCSQINFRRTRRKVKPPPEMRNCSECGNAFPVTRMGKLTCSDQCSRVRWLKVKESRKVAGHITDAELDQRALVDLDRLRTSDTYRQHRSPITEMQRWV